jgi:Tat protein translocase TatB subunit
MFGVGFPELVLIFIVALLLFGPDKLPEIARTIGKIITDLKRTADEVKEDFEKVILDEGEEIKGDIEDTLLNLGNLDKEEKDKRDKG